MARANLEQADLSYAKADGVDFRLANLKSAVFHFTQLMGANLEGANLTNADFSNANLRNANLKKVNFAHVELDGADLRGADLRGALNIDVEELSDAIGDASTKLPEDISIPKGWLTAQ